MNNINNEDTALLGGGACAKQVEYSGTSGYGWLMKYSLANELRIVNKEENPTNVRNYLEEVYTILCNIIKTPSSSIEVPSSIVDILIVFDSDMEFISKGDSQCGSNKITTNLPDSALTDLQISINYVKKSAINNDEEEDVSLRVYMVESSVGVYSYLLLSNSCIHIVDLDKSQLSNSSNLICMIDSIGIVCLDKHICAERSLIRPSLDTAAQEAYKMVLPAQEELQLSLQNRGMTTTFDKVYNCDINFTSVPYNKLPVTTEEIFGLFDNYSKSKYFVDSINLDYDESVGYLKDVIDSFNEEMFKFVASTNTDLYCAGEFICLGTSSSRLLINKENTSNLSEFLILNNSTYIDNRDVCDKGNNGGIKYIVDSSVYNLIESSVEMLSIYDSTIVQSSLLSVSSVVKSTIVNSIIGNLFRGDIEIKDSTIDNSIINVSDISQLDYTSPYFTAGIRKLIGVTLYSYNTTLKGDVFHGLDSYTITPNQVLLVDVCYEDRYEENIPTSMHVTFDSGYILMIKGSDASPDIIKKELLKILLKLGDD